jgi:general stress protein 26
MITAVVTD